MRSGDTSVWARSVAIGWLCLPLQPLLPVSIGRSRAPQEARDPIGSEASLPPEVALTKLGELERAAQLGDEILAALEAKFQPGHPALLHARGTRANIMEASGDHAGALALWESVHELRARILVEDHPELLRTERNVAFTRHLVDDRAGARRMARSLLEGQRKHAEALCSESPRIARAGALQQLLLLAAPLSWTGSDDDEDAGLAAELFETVACLRQVSTSTSAVAIAAGRDPEVARLRERVSETRSRLNALGLAPPERSSEVEAWRNELVELAEERDRLERELRRSLSSQGIFTDWPTARAVARSLAPDSAFVSFLRYPRAASSAEDAVDSLAAFLITSEGVVRCVQLGPSAPLEELANRWRALLGQPVVRGVAIEGSGEEEDDVGKTLRDRLIQPCFTALGKNRPIRLHIVLDDFLHLVPIEALPLDDGQRLGQQVRIQIEVSARRLVEPTARVAGDGILLAIGDVDFEVQDPGDEGERLAVVRRSAEARSGARKGAPDHFARLIQSRYEVQAAATLFEEMGAGDSVVLLRGDAAKDALIGLAPSARFLHVATTAGSHRRRSLPYWTAPKTSRPGRRLHAPSPRSAGSHPRPCVGWRSPGRTVV